MIVERPGLLQLGGNVARYEDIDVVHVIDVQSVQSQGGSTDDHPAVTRAVQRAGCRLKRFLESPWRPHLSANAT